MINTSKFSSENIKGMDCWRNKEQRKDNIKLFLLKQGVRMSVSNAVPQKIQIKNTNLNCHYHTPEDS
jgi:hypothetical protein